MIRKLQTRFIIISMTAFLTVLTVMIAAINIANYIEIVRDADQLLHILLENEGSFPAGPPEISHQQRQSLSPETPYESRYFSVILNANSGDVIRIDTSKIVSVNSTEAVAYAQAAFGAGKGKGFSDQFRYASVSDGQSVRFVFLDCGRGLDAFRHFLLASIGISLFGCLFVLLLVFVFSHRFIRPVSESYEKQKRFITDAGHEIKTPITIISADAEVLELELGPNEWLQDIQKQTTRLAALTNHLIYLAKMEENAEPLVMVELPFSDLIAETAVSFQAQARIKNQSFTCSIQPMLCLKGNEQALRELIGILLDNALKYAPEAGIIRLKAEKQNSGVKMTVWNSTERPVPKENLSCLFDRFYRSDPSRSTQSGGYGIGLSVAKAIVSAHHGKIQAVTEDRENTNGLCISVHLP